MWVTIGPYSVSTWGLGNFEGMYNCEISLMSICVGKCFLFVFFKKLQKDNWCLFNLKILPNKLLPDVSGIKISATSEMWSFLVHLRKMDQNRPTNLKNLVQLFDLFLENILFKQIYRSILDPSDVVHWRWHLESGKCFCVYICVFVYLKMDPGWWIADYGQWKVDRILLENKHW